MSKYAFHRSEPTQRLNDFLTGPRPLDGRFQAIPNDARRGSQADQSARQLQIRIQSLYCFSRSRVEIQEQKAKSQELRAKSPMSSGLIPRQPLLTCPDDGCCAAAFFSGSHYLPTLTPTIGPKLRLLTLTLFRFRFGFAALLATVCSVFSFYINDHWTVYVFELFQGLQSAIVFGSVLVSPSPHSLPHVIPLAMLYIYVSTYIRTDLRVQFRSAAVRTCNDYPRLGDAGHPKICGLTAIGNQGLRTRCPSDH